MGIWAGLGVGAGAGAGAGAEAGPGCCWGWGWGVLRLEPNFLPARLEIDLHLGFVTGTWVGLETDGLGGSAGRGWGGGGRSFAIGT